MIQLEGSRIEVEMSGKKNLADEVYLAVREKILRQEIPCGSKISVEQLIDELNVSRTPINSAFVRLNSEGIVKLHPHRYAEVVSFSLEDIRDLGMTRIAVDTLAVQLAIQHGSNADFEKLEMIAEECYQVAEKGDVFNWIRLECEFHLGLARIGKSENLIRIMEDLYQRIRLMQFVNYKKDDISLKMIELHFDLLKELKKRNIPGALEVIHRHLGYFYDISPGKLRSVIINY